MPRPKTSGNTAFFSRNDWPQVLEHNAYQTKNAPYARLPACGPSLSGTGTPEGETSRADIRKRMSALFYLAALCFSIARAGREVELLYAANTSQSILAPTTMSNTAKQRLRRGTSRLWEIRTPSGAVIMLQMTRLNSAGR